MSQPLLFQPITLGGVTARNRILISPMCQYSATDGVANDWHLVHLGKFAQGGAGIVMVEATAVTAEGRITHGDIGLWHDGQIAPLERIATFLRDNGAVPAIQLAHAGRKASMQRPWFGNAALNADDRARGDLPWRIVAPSADPDGRWLADAACARSSTNWRRLREHGGSPPCAPSTPVSICSKCTARTAICCTNSCRRCRTGAPTAMAATAPSGCAIRWRSSRPCARRGPRTSRCRCGFRRSTASMAAWSLPIQVAFAREAKARGVDLIDCSSGGLLGSATAARIPRGYGFQVPYAERDPQAGGHRHHRGRPHPASAAGRGYPGAGAGRSDRDRPRGAVRSELAAARAARAGRRRATKCSRSGRSNMAGGWSGASRACASSTARRCRSGKREARPPAMQRVRRRR